MIFAKAHLVLSKEFACRIHLTFEKYEPPPEILPHVDIIK